MMMIFMITNVLLLLVVEKYQEKNQSSILLRDGLAVNLIYS